MNIRQQKIQSLDAWPFFDNGKNGAIRAALKKIKINTPEALDLDISVWIDKTRHGQSRPSLTSISGYVRKMLGEKLFTTPRLLQDYLASLMGVPPVPPQRQAPVYPSERQREPRHPDQVEVARAKRELMRHRFG